MEAQWVTGPAKNLIGFATRLRTAPPCDLPHIELSVAAFQRPSAPADRFLSALEAAEIPVHIIRERCTGDPRVMHQLLSMADVAKPDIIQTHNSKSHFLLRISGLSRRVRWIAFHHGFTARDKNDVFYNRIARWALCGAPHVVTVCKAFANDLTACGVPDSRITIHHNMVEAFVRPPESELATLRDGLGIPDGVRVVLAVGRLSAEKGHTDLLDAMALLRPGDTRLIVVGDGVERRRLEARCAALNLSNSVIFVGHQASAAPYYAIADIFVLPSHSEGSPNVLLEAMAAGVPIVCTAAGGTAELVSHEQTALVTPCHDSRSLSAAIGRLLADTDLARRLGAAARLDSRARTPEVYTTSLIQLYQAVTGRSCGASRPLV